MADITHIVGVDPGLVHTGCVRLLFRPHLRQVWVGTLVVAKVDGPVIRDWAQQRKPSPTIYIEGFRARHNYSTNTEMIQAVAEVRACTKGTVLSNIGVKQVVRRDLMDLLGVWRFATTTHHQDLRSAAMIALFGMLKQDETNRLLADVVADHLAGATWSVYT